jgi:nitrogen fixation protein NifU and related proteins
MIEDLYHDQIIEWSKRTGHVRRLDHVHCKSTAANQLCGDRISVELELDGEIIKNIACNVRGCVLCKASSSVLAEKAAGLKLNQLTEIGVKLEQALKSSSEDLVCFPKEYTMFFPVRSHKSRHSCVTLPFEAVTKAIEEYRASSSPKEP